MFESPKSTDSEPLTSQLPTSQFSVSKFFATEPLSPELFEFYTFMRESILTMFDIVNEAQDVSVDLESLERNAKWMVETAMKHNEDDNFLTYSFQCFRYPRDYFPIIDIKMINLSFILHALNFSLWDSRNAKQWTVNGLTGYMALCFTMRRALSEGRPMWNPRYYSILRLKEVEIIFRGDNCDTCIPLINERVTTMQEVGKVLMDKYQGCFVNCVNIANGNVFELQYLLYKEFKSYRDTVNYNGKEVYIGCKASTLINDLKYRNWISGETPWTSATFADYCVPRALVKIKILRYSNRLIAKFAKSDEPLEHGCREDIELRCGTLVACKCWSERIRSLCDEYMKNKVIVDKRLGVKLHLDSRNMIDNYLWVVRHWIDESELNDTIPFHYIRSIYY